VKLDMLLDNSLFESPYDGTGEERTVCIAGALSSKKK